MFEKYINSYVESNFSIAFKFSISPLRDLYNSVNNKNSLEKLEYYDLLKNNYTYEKITNEIINESNITIDGLMNKYSISHRTAYYIKGEYDICNDSEEQYIQLRILVGSNCHLNNAEIIETSFIRNYFLFSSSITANRLSVRLIEIIFSELLKNIQDGYYNKEISDVLTKTQNNEKDKTSVLNFSNYLEQMSKMDLTNIDNKKQLIYKLVEKIFESKGRITISLNPLKKLAKI